MTRRILWTIAMLVGLPLVAMAEGPNVCSQAYLWLDASKTDTMTISGSEITEWRSVNGGAKAAKYTLTGQYASVTPSGPTVADGLVSFGSTSANRDLGFTKSTNIRAVFMVAKVEGSANAFLLGDNEKFQFHRGSGGEYWQSTHGYAGKNGKTYFNGVEVKNPTSSILPNRLGLIDVQANDGIALTASQLCYDRKGNGSSARRGGKAIAEVLIFTNTLSVAEQKSVRDYLMTKWSVWEQGDAKVVRAHPRLTIGLERESLIGIKLTDGQSGALTNLTVRFDLTNCTPEQITDVRVWRQKYDPVPFTFFERDAVELKLKGVRSGELGVRNDGIVTVDFVATNVTSDLTIYPKNWTMGEGDYIWVTAKIDERIATNAEIWASIEGDRVRLTSGDFKLSNQVAKAPHRPFPYKHHIGAYVRQDRLVGNGSTTWDIFSGNPKERFENLTDVLPIYSMKDGYSNGKFYISNWDNGRNDTASTARLVELRNQHHPACMIRPSLTPSSWVTANGIYGLAFEVAGAAEATRRQFAETIVEFLVKHNCDGLDIDYEWVRDGTNHREWQNIGKMLRELSEQFFDHGFVLSFAGRSHDSAQSGMPYSEEDYGAFNVSDYMMMQSYGGGWLNSAPSIQRRTLDVCTKRLLPLRRVVMGQAAYVSADGHPGWDGASYKIEAMTKDPLRRFDIDTWWKSPYSSYWPFEGMSSLQAQCLWARRKELGGVMSWGYYTDPTWYGWSSFGRHQSKAIWPMPNNFGEPEVEVEVEGQGGQRCYLLKTEEDWFWLYDHPNVKAKLGADITLTHDPLVIDEWTGELDGTGHTLTIAEDTWIASEKATGLIRTLAGTVKNLTVKLDGRVYTVAARWNDQSLNPADVRLTNTLSGENPVGVIAAEAGEGATIENVTVVMGAGSEVKGVKYAGGLVGKVSGAATIKNNRVEVGGKLHIEVRNIWDTLFLPNLPDIGAIAGHVSSSAGATISGNSFSVVEGGEIQDLDAIPDAPYEIIGEWREPSGWDTALPMEVDVRSGDWALEVELELPNYTGSTLTAGKYPQLISLVGQDTSVALSASGDGGGELFLTGSGEASYAYPVSKAAIRGNKDVGSGVKLGVDDRRRCRIVIENIGGELRIGQNGATILVADKNNADDGYLVKALVGSGIAQLGGGKIVSVRLKTNRRDALVHPEGYGKLIFADEFDGDTLNTENWARVPVMKSGAPDWRKYTSDRADLVAVSNGCLVLTGAKNDKSDPSDTRKYQCGQVQSSGKFSFKYGMVEIRAKFTNQDGAWPAMWMMPQYSPYGGWPRSGEIDITERLNDEAKVYETAHFGATDTTSGTTASIVNNQFNVYRLEWTENELVWYVNGVRTHSYSNDGSGYLKWPFDSEFYFILSQQLEGKWVGTVDDETTLPNRMYIDYVRVWQKDETDAKANAYLWLDAKAEGTVVTNEVGDVQAWHSANACGKSATRYTLDTDSPNAPIFENGIVSFGNTSANRDLKFDRATDLRTVFMVAKVEQSGNAFLLGDSSNYDFHRGANGEYWNATYAHAGIREGRTLWNGERVESPTSATMPGELGLIEVHTASGVTASQLCYDRAGNGSTARRGGKDIAELIAFREELDETQSAEIRRYLMMKWGVGSMATWTFTESGLEKTGSAAPSLLWVMNPEVDAGAIVENDTSLVNLSTVNMTLAEKPVTLNFTNQVATIVAGAETILARTNMAKLVVASGRKATLLDGVTMGNYELDAGGTIRNESDWSGGKGVGGAFIASDAGTYEFKNIKFTGGLQSDYKVRVTDGDNIVIDGNNNNNGRCKFAFDVQGGKVTFPAGNTTWVENANYHQSGGEFISQLTSTTQEGTGYGFMLGFNNIAMTLDITGGLFSVPNSSLNFYNPVTLNIGGTGIVRAKGYFRSASNAATINVNSGGTLEVGSLGMKASTCALNLKGGNLKGYEANAEVHDNVNFLSPSVLASSEGGSLKLSGNLYGGSTFTLKGGSTLILPSNGALTFGLKTDCAGVKVTDSVLDFGTTRGAELSVLTGTGTIRISLTDAERKMAKDGIKLFKWSGGNYTGNITVVPNVGGEAGLVLKDGYLVFTPAIVALKATVSSITNWCDIVWIDDFGNREIGNAVTNYAAQITAKDGAIIRVKRSDSVNAISMAISGKVTVHGENLSYLPWSDTDVGGTVVYAGDYDLGTGIAGFAANGTYEFATNCTITANKFMTGNTYDVVQTFNQYGYIVVTNDGAGTSTSSSPAIFAHWGSGRPSTVTYNLLGGDFVATHSTRYALYFGADGKATLNIGGGEGAARMKLTGLAQGTDSSARTQSGAINIYPKGALEIGSGGIYLRNANTAFNLAGGTLKFTENCSVAINNANRVNLSADSTVEVAPGKNVSFAHPWTGSGKLALAGGGTISMSIDIPSKNVHDGIAVDIAKVASDFPTSKCQIYFTCEEYEGIREAAKVEVVNGVLKATPKVDTSVWVQTDITGNNANLQFTCLQAQSSFYRGKSEYQPLIGLRADKLQHTALWRVYAQLSSATDPTMIADVKLYKTTTPYFAAASEVTSAKVSVTKPSATNRTIIFDFWNNGSGSGSLPSVAVGDYLWVCVRLNANATAHAELDAKITNVHVNGQVAYLYNVDPKGAGEVYPYEYHVVPYWRLNNWTLSALTRQHFACYTEIIPFYITVNANGSVGHGWNGEQFTDEKFQAAIDKIKKLRAGKDVKLLVGVGMSQGNLPTVCANETLRKTAAKNLAAFVKKFGLDGVDFDWEYPTTKAHWEGWCNLVADLKPLLFRQGGGKLVSVAVTGWKTQQAGKDLGAGDAVKGLYQQCDFVNMMSYDGSEAAGHSTLALMNNDFTRAATYGGIPNYKICGGQAFYTNHYPCDGSQYGFNWVVNNYPQYVDSVDKFTASDGKIYTYNSLATIRTKTARCKAIGGGAMIWANETDVALTHAKSATRAMFSQIYPSRGSAMDGSLTISEAADWPAIVSVGSATLGADITLDAGVLRPAAFKGTLDGKGHTITVNDSAPIIASNSGTLKNVTVRYTDGVKLIYDANGNAIRSCDYPNVGEAPVTLTGAQEVSLGGDKLYATVGAMVDLPENYAGDIISIRLGAFDIWIQSVVEEGYLKLQLGCTQNGVRKTGCYGSDVLVTAGPHAISLTCGSWIGTSLYLDGEKVSSASDLIFSNQKFAFAKIGGEGLGLYAYDVLPGYMGSFVYPYLASYPAFNEIAIHADDDPLELTELSVYASNAVATVFASVASPIFETSRPVLDFTVKQGGNTFLVEAYREGETTTRLGWRYLGSTSRTFASQTVTARETLGHRVWHLSYDATGGSYLDINGKSAAASPATKWSGSQVNGIALGLTAGSVVGARQWLVGQAKAADPKEPLGGLVTPPAWFGNVDTAAQDYLFGMLGTDIETYKLPAITVNGKTASTNEAILAMRYFAGDPTEARDYTLALDAPVVDGTTVTLGLWGDQPINAALQLLLSGGLTNDWRVAAELPVGSPERAFSFPLDIGGNFYKLRASESVTEKARNDMPLVSSSRTQANLGVVKVPDEGEVVVQLEGVGVVEGLLGYMTHDGIAYTARVQADGKMVFNLPSLPTYAATCNLTLVVPKGAANGDIHIAGSSTRALVTEVVADNLYKDKFSPVSGFGSYRIPALVTDGAGEVLCCYDVRYGGGDLGTGDGIDIGETYSADYGASFALPRLAVDVPNTRDKYNVSHGYAKTNDIGDVALLFDPKTETYWMMGMTGTGLYQGNYSMNDVVMYTRGKGKGAEWKPWKNPQSNSTDPMEYRSIKETIMSQPGIKNASSGKGYGFLEGPGHGFVTSKDVVYTNNNIECTMPAGTLVFPTQYFVDSSLTKSTVGAVYSTDHGTNWIATARSTAGTNPQENCVMELDDGSWYMTTKAGSRPGTGRINFFRTKDYKNWNYVGEYNPVPCQQGSCLRLGKASDGKGRYVLCHTLHPDTATRAQVALVFGTDTTGELGDTAGISWDFSNPLMLYYENTGFKGYNSLCMIDDHTLGVLYEAQGHIYFIRIDVSNRMK